MIFCIGKRNNSFLTYITVSNIFITFVLLSVNQPKHGYAIMQFIEEKTNGRLVLGAGTLYGALKSLEERGWIIPCSNAAGLADTVLLTEL